MLLFYWLVNVFFVSVSVCVKVDSEWKNGGVYHY